MPHLQISGVQTLDNTDFFFSYYLPFPIEINCSTSHVVDLTENMVVSPLHRQLQVGLKERRSLHIHHHVPKNLKPNQQKRTKKLEK